MIMPVPFRVRDGPPHVEAASPRRLGRLAAGTPLGAVAHQEMRGGVDGLAGELAKNAVAQIPAADLSVHAGNLLAISEPGAGRVVVITDAGWINNSVFEGKGLGGVVIKDDDNWEIFKRLALWAAEE